MPNEKLVSIRGVHNLLKSEAYRLYNEQKQEILKDYGKVVGKDKNGKDIIDSDGEWK
jgi:hypothetical protein